MAFSDLENWLKPHYFGYFKKDIENIWIFVFIQHTKTEFYTFKAFKDLFLIYAQCVCFSSVWPQRFLVAPRKSH